MPTDVFIENRRGEQLVGTLAKSNGPVGEMRTTAAGSRKRLCILCHGFHADRNYHLLKKLSNTILESNNTIDCVFRFDFSGNGESEGEFKGFGGYESELHDLEDVVAHFRNQKSGGAALYEVVALVGHSKGASSVLHYAARHDDVAVVVSLAARHNMRVGIRERLGEKRMDELLTKGSVKYSDPAMTNAATITITRSQYEERIGLDNTVVSSENIRRVRKLRFVHGLADKVIPAEDAQAFLAQFDAFDDTDCDAQAVLLENSCGHTMFRHVPEVAKVVSDCFSEL